MEKLKKLELEVRLLHQRHTMALGIVYSIVMLISFNYTDSEVLAIKILAMFFVAFCVVGELVVLKHIINN